MSLIALVGSHRVGKTTLAKAYAEKHEIVFLETSVSAIFRDLGHNPSDVFDFTTRLDIQEEILVRLDALYGEQDPLQQIIADRSPLDLLAYTMAEAIGAVVKRSDQKRFAAYAAKCFEMTNRRFSTVILVQPGIPLVKAKAKGKAALNQAYIEHLNTLILGLTLDERQLVTHFYIPRRLLTMEDRIAAVEGAVGRSMQTAARHLDLHVANGGLVH